MIMGNKMTQRAMAACTSVVVCACAAPPPAPRPPPQVLNTSSPRCADDRACATMWLRAQDTLQSLAGMRLRIITTDRIETFAPTGVARLGGTVTKWPVDGGGYELRVHFECYRGGFDCDDLRVQAMNLFNLTVGGADSMKR